VIKGGDGPLQCGKAAIVQLEGDGCYLPTTLSTGNPKRALRPAAVAVASAHHERSEADASMARIAGPAGVDA
jgi:hypothetical protein